MSSSQSKILGERFGPYVLVSRLGLGGMAETFIAVRHGPGDFTQTVCLKLVLPYFRNNPEFLALFEREAKLAAKLRHRNIVGVIDFGEIDGTSYIALELVDGLDLGHILDCQDGHRLAPDFVAMIGIEIAEALEHAHHPPPSAGIRAADDVLGIVHRDISPSNVLLSKQGEILLTDFGLAKAMSGASGRQSAVKGKVPYMSPEQLRAEPIDGRADLFSLGVVLFETLAGRRPYEAPHDPGTIMLIMKGEHPPLWELAPEVQPELCEVVERLIKPNPEDRPASAAALIEELDAFAPTSRTRLRLGKLVRELREQMEEIDNEAAANRAAAAGRPTEDIDDGSGWLPATGTQQPVSPDEPQPFGRTGAGAVLEPYEPTHDAWVSAERSHPHGSARTVDVDAETPFDLRVRSRRHLDAPAQLPSRSEEPVIVRQAPSPQMAWRQAPALLTDPTLSATRSPAIPHAPAWGEDPWTDVEDDDALPRRPTVAGRWVLAALALAGSLAAVSVAIDRVGYNHTGDAPTAPADTSHSRTTPPPALSREGDSATDPDPIAKNGDGLERNLADDPPEQTEADPVAQSIAPEPEETAVPEGDRPVSGDVGPSGEASVPPSAPKRQSLAEAAEERRVEREPAPSDESSDSVTVRGSASSPAGVSDKPRTPPKAALGPKLGQLSITVFPWGNIWIDGQPWGRDPLLKEPLPAGKYHVSAGQDGPEKSRVVFLRGGENRTVHFDLTKE